jgi:hypothetical protein
MVVEVEGMLEGEVEQVAEVVFEQVVVSALASYKAKLLPIERSNKQHHIVN